MPNRPSPSAVVFAKNIESMAGFYREVAEMAEVHRDSDHIVLDEEGFQLVIHGIPAMYADMIEITQPPQVREETPIKICIPVASIEFARNKASELGGRIDGKDREWRAGDFTACDGYDPEGNVFQVRESAA